MSETLQRIVSSYSSFSHDVTWSSVLIYGSIFGVSWALYKLIISPYLNPLRKIPGRPVRNIFIGNMGEIFSNECIDPYVRWVNEMKTGVIRYRHILGGMRVLIADADAMKHIMVTHSKNFPKPEFLFRLFRRVTGDGLISLNGHEHLTQRKLCLGAFKSSYLKNMLPAMQRHMEELANLLIKNVQENRDVELDIEADINRTTMDIIAECGFGYNTNALLNPDQEGTKAFAYLLGGFRPSIFGIIFPTIYAKLPTEKNREFSQRKTMADSLIQSVISNKKEVLKECSDDSKLSDLLSLLLMARDTESGEGLSSEQLTAHVMTFMLAGHETTATSTTWCLMKMCQNPEIQKRVQNEAASILPVKGQPITLEHLDKMTYMNCVVKETLRLYPAAPMSFRCALNDDTINGYHIPAGTIVNIHIGALHRNPAYWDDPLEFRPERFMDESKIHPYSYLPFTAGPRMCIGYKFAQLELKLMIAILMREFNFSLPNPDQYYKKKQRITMRPEPSLKLKATLLNE